MPSLSKTQVLVTIIAVLLVANLAMLLFFYGNRQQQKKNAQRSKPHYSITNALQEKVGFDKDQLEKVKELRHKHWDTMKVLFDNLQKSKVRFYDQVKAGTINDSLLQQQADEIGRTQEAIDLQALKNLRAIRSLCTPYQLPLYDSIIPAVVQNMWFPDRHHDSEKKRQESSESKSHNK